MSNARIMNEAFAYKLGFAEDREKLAAEGGKYIRDRLREESFTRQILPPQTVTRADLQVSINHDTLVKIVEVEPGSQAMTMSFRSQPESTYVRGDRFEVPLFTIGSKRVEMTEDELEAYTLPIMEIIRRNSVKDMQELVDHVFLGNVEKGVQALQKEANGIAFTASGFTDTTACSAYNVNAGTCLEVGKVKANDVLFQTSGGGAAASAAAGLTQGVGAGIAPVIVPMQKDDLTKLFKLFPGDGGVASRLVADSFLMTATDAEDINNWTLSDVGDDLVKSTTVDGFKYKALLGRKFIKTLKVDILRPGNVYAFAPAEFYGGFLSKGGPKFFADKERNRISWEAWETMGMYIGNIAGARKLELYAASTDLSSGTSNATSLAKYAPKAEADLGAKNNRVSDAQSFPQVSGF